MRKVFFTMDRIIAFIVLSVLGYCSCNIKLTILHTNDIHAHFDSVNGKHGGIARIKAKVRREICRISREI